MQKIYIIIKNFILKFLIEKMAIPFNVNCHTYFP